MLPIVRRALIVPRFTLFTSSSLHSSRISGPRNGFIESLGGKSFLSSDPLFGCAMAQSVLIARRLPFLPSSGYWMHVIGLIVLQAEYVMCNKWSDYTSLHVV